ncbi:unnamed protein product [Cuscuta campestris]|uniref:Uncharacterized protein n=1 Tax=Cuscuta campestris TaxID=132261 RepID=A0A484MHN1_9ASTE|nr:unnamed protein product [Cuscuta campestris]
MDPHDYFLDSIIPETEFQDGWGEVEDLISDDSEMEEVIAIHSDDEVIIINSDDDGADPAPIREMQCFINIQSQEDCNFVDGRQEGDEMEEFERPGFDSSQPMYSRVHLHIDMLNILLPSADPDFWASKYK